MRNTLLTYRLAIAIVATLQPLAAGELLAANPVDTTPAAPAKPVHSVEAEDRFVPGGFDRRQQAINERLDAGNLPAWAGRYYGGEGISEYIELTLAPDAGATMTWRGTFGLLNANHGAVIESAQGTIRIAYVAPNEHEKYFKFPSELVPIAWGERQYLAPPDAIAEFVSTINHGDEPRLAVRGRFLLRAGDNEKPVTGLPVLPPSTQAQVRREAVEVRVTSAERTWHTKAEGGCAERYRLRMAAVTAPDVPLFVEEQLTKPRMAFPAVAIVTALHGASVDAEFFRYSCDLVELPQRGDLFTTGAYVEAAAANRVRLPDSAVPVQPVDLPDYHASPCSDH